MIRMMTLLQTTRPCGFLRWNGLYVVFDDVDNYQNGGLVMKGWGITLSMIYRIIYKNFCRNTATRRERSAAATVSGDFSGIGMSLSGEH